MKRPVIVLIQALFAFYLYALFKIILFKFHPVDRPMLWERFKLSLANPTEVILQIRQGNLIPFHEISRMMEDSTSHDAVNLIGNVAIFMPLGFFLGLMTASRNPSAAAALILSFGLSLCLEGAQAVLAIGRFDVDDLILNADGGLIGFAAFRLAVRFKGTPSNDRRRNEEAA